MRWWKFILLFILGGFVFLAIGFYIGKGQSVFVQKRFVVVDTVRWESPPVPLIHRVETVKRVVYERVDTTFPNRDSLPAVLVNESVDIDNDTVSISFVRRQFLNKFTADMLEKEEKAIYGDITVRYLRIPTRVVESKVFVKETWQDRVSFNVLATNRGVGVGVNYRVFQNFGIGFSVVP